MILLFLMAFWKIEIYWEDMHRLPSKSMMCAWSPGARRTHHIVLFGSLVCFHIWNICKKNLSCNNVLQIIPSYLRGYRYNTSEGVLHKISDNSLENHFSYNNPKQTILFVVAKHYSGCGKDPEAVQRIDWTRLYCRQKTPQANSLTLRTPLGAPPSRRGEARPTPEAILVAGQRRVIRLTGGQ